MRKDISYLGFCIGVYAATTCSLLCAKSPSPRDDARRIFELSKVKGGVVVHYGCGVGRLTAALGLSSEYTVQGLSSDQEQITKARKRLVTKRPAGNVTFLCRRKDSLPYTDNLVNLFVAEDPVVPSMDEIMRVLAPLGVACIKRDGGWHKTVKPWPRDIDEWTHWRHGADGNPVARDTIVGPPRGIQWIAYPRWPKSHDTSPSLTGMVTARGRLFYIADTGPAGICNHDHDLQRWHLCARDAFNGVLLWKRSIEDWGNRAWSPGAIPWAKGRAHHGGGPWISNPRVIHKRLVAQGDHVYVTLGFREPVSRLDAATGTEVRTYKGTAFTSEIVLSDNTLFLVVDRAAQRAGKHIKKPDKSVVAFDPTTGRMVWEHEGFHGIVDGKYRSFTTITRLNLTVGGGRVFIHNGDAVVALDAGTGDECWRVSVNLPDPKKPRTFHASDWAGDLIYSDGVLYNYQQVPGRGIRLKVQAIDSEDGSPLWKRTCGGAGFRSMVSIYKARDLVWVLSDPEKRPPMRRSFHLLGLDPRSGGVKKEFDIRNIMTSVHHHRCYRNKATENYIIYSRNGLEFACLQSGEINNNRWVRGICGYGIMPANGLLFVPPQPCICFPNVRSGGFITYAPQNKKLSRRVPDGQRLQQGPAYGARIKAPGLTHSAWRMYRHDARRSGASPVQFPGTLKTAWTCGLNEPITAPTVGWGKVFVAGAETRRMIALDANSGRIAWAVPVDYRVDTPPTLWRGRIYFGTTGGYVYCLRASDGALVWRFNANPMVKTILVYGNIESAWPVHGSVVVRAGVVYFSAGRTTYVDGGLRFYSLDARTGRQRSFARRDTAGQGARKPGADLPGVHNDLLVHDGKKLYLKNLVLDPETLTGRAALWPYDPFIRGPGRWERKFEGAPLVNLGGGFLDDSLYDRSAYVLNQRQSARKLVFSDDIMVGLRWGVSRRGRLLLHNGIFEVGRDRYTVFARKRKHGNKPADQSKRRKGLQDQWARTVPLRVEAMSLSAGSVFAAGPPMPRDKPLTPAFVLRSLKGREGGILIRLNRRDGVSRKNDIFRLPAPPVWDGIALSTDGLFVALRDGRVMKLEAGS